MRASGTTRRSSALRRRPALATLLAACLIGAGAGAVSGAAPAIADPSCTIYWTGSTSSDWTLATNWSLSDGGVSAGRVPGVTDAVCMSTMPARADVSFPAGSSTVRTITFEKTDTVTPSLTIVAGELAVDVATPSFVENLSLRPGSSLAGAVQVTSVAEDDATLASPGSLTLTGSGAVDGLSLGVGYALVNRGDLTQCGDISAADGGGSATFENAGTFSASQSCQVRGMQQVDVINDLGATINLVRTYSFDHIVNHGTVKVRNGISSGQITNDGVLDLVNGSTLEMTAGSSVVASPGAVTGSGRLLVDGGELHGGAGTVPYLANGAGELTGDVIADRVDLAGTVHGSGSLTATGFLTTGTGTVLQDGFRLINKGSLQYRHPRNVGCRPMFVLNTGASIRNEGGIDVFKCGQAATGFTGDGTGSFVNAVGGTVHINVPHFTFDTQTTNDGVLDMYDGASAVFTNLTNLVSTTLTGGAYIMRGVVTVPGPVVDSTARLGTFPTGMMRTPDGSNALTGLESTSGDVVLRDDMTFQHALTNSGLFRVDYPGGVVQVPGYVQTAGKTTVTAGNVLRSGDSGAGLIDIDSGIITGRGSIIGHTHIGGTLDGGDTQGTLSLGGDVELSDASTTTVGFALHNGHPAAQPFISSSGAVTLSGSLSVRNNGVFALSPGEQYVVIRAANGITGTFANVQLATLPSGQHLELAYTATDVVLTVRNNAVITVADVSQAEGDSGRTVLSVPVTLDAPSDLPVTFSYRTVNGTASAGTDYARASGSSMIAAGSTSVDIPVKVLGDTEYERDETFQVVLSAATNARYGRPIGVETIRNDDPAPPPTVSGIDRPGIGQNASGIAVTVSGTGFAPNALVGLGSTDLTVVSQTVQSTTMITAVLSSDSAAVVGPRDVKVRNPGVATVGVCSRCFAVTAKPTAYSLSQPLGAGAESRTVSVTGTDFQPGASAAFTGGITAVTTYVSPTKLSLVMSVPRTTAAGSYEMQVLNPDGGNGGCGDCLVVVPGPAVTSMLPDTVARGVSTAITISGSGFATGARVTGPAGVSFSQVDVLDDSTIAAWISVSSTAVIGAHRVVKVTNPPAAGSGTGIYSGLTITDARRPATTQVSRRRYG